VASVVFAWQILLSQSLDEVRDQHTLRAHT